MCRINLQGMYFQFGKLKTPIHTLLPNHHLLIYFFVCRPLRVSVWGEGEVRYRELISPQFLITMQPKGGRESLV